SLRGLAPLQLPSTIPQLHVSGSREGAKDEEVARDHGDGSSNIAAPTGTRLCSLSARRSAPARFRHASRSIRIRLDVFISASRVSCGPGSSHALVSTTRIGNGGSA